MGVFQRQGVYWVDCYVNGRRIRRRIGTSKKLAEQVLYKMRVDDAKRKFLLEASESPWPATIPRARQPLERKYLYFARCGDAVKIGVSDNPALRLGDLQVGCPAPVVLLQKIRDAGHLERSCHKRLAHLRLRGEWFRYTDEVEMLIRELRQRKTKEDRDRWIEANQMRAVD